MTRNTVSGLLFCFLLLLAAMPARADDVPVVIGAHEGYTRLVFDFPKLTAYRVVKTPAGLDVTFDTPHTMTAPAKLPAYVTAFDVSRPDAETLKASIGMGAGTDFKHYRLLKKIVVDITATQKPAVEKPPAQIAEKAQTKPPAEKAPPEPVKITPPAPIAVAPPAEEKAPAVVAAQTSASVLAHADEAPAPKAAPVAPVTAEAVPEPEPDSTSITISTVTPTKIAVFKRFGFLWIVADREVSNAFAPPVEGRLAGVIGKPKFFKFGEGRGWRYLMPPETYVSIVKKGMNWRILLSTAKTQKNGAIAANIDVDHTSNKAKFMAQLQGAGEVISFEDPAAGDLLYVVATDRENLRVDSARRFPEFEVLPAEMGMVVRPLSDVVKANRLGDYVMVTAPNGLTITANVVSSVASTGEDDEGSEGGADTLFNFPDWRMGGIEELYKNESDIVQQIAAAQTPEEKSSLYMKLAWLYFANNFGQETLGLLAIVEAENADMAKTPDFIALKGAANAMAGHYAEALQYLNDPSIQQHPEVNMWIGYAAAATEQWHKANQSFPKNNRLLVRYPDNIAIPFTLYMAESALRLGRTDTARALLGSVSAASEEFSPQYKAALSYLRGEAFRQQGDIDGAVRTWQPVAKGIDRLYHTKASLALANLLLQEKKLSLKDAIDQVDSLRFAWRGDGLEVQILQNLGDLKVKDGQYLSGLQDMKQAAELADSMDDDATPIRDNIRRTFANLYIDGAAEKIPPLEAVSIYNEFSNLMPPGQESADANLHFADYLIRMDLLSKAETIFEDNLKAGTVPDAKVPAIGAKLAAIYLLDANPAGALNALDNTARGGLDEKQVEERTLLRARAQGDLKQTDAAIATLSALTSNDAQKLKIDVLWRAQKWAEAAKAIEPLLPPPAAKMTDDEAKVVLNMVVAAKLAGNTAKLDEIKAKYTAGMGATSLASTFGVVTRDTGVSSLSDRDTILKMAGEVDMFKGFLDNYKAGVGTGG